MKIDDTSGNIQHLSNLEIPVNKNIDDDKNISDESDKGLVSGAKVELSNRSVEYSKAAEAMDRTTEERAQKLEEIKLRLENGSYEIDSRKVADSIIKDILGNIVEP
jgi:flagellar biosynthesis anti-sigma factor FlgM